MDAQVNLKAFRDTIGKSEGADYDTLFGGGKFTDFSTHPNKKIPYGKTFSTAAGKYQILYHIWQALCKRIGRTDFSPETQDLMANELLKDCKAYAHVCNGEITDAIECASKEWASMPNNNYGQPKHTEKQISDWYLSFGGGI